MRKQMNNNGGNRPYMRLSDMSGAEIENNSNASAGSLIPPTHPSVVTLGAPDRVQRKSHGGASIPGTGLEDSMSQSINNSNVLRGTGSMVSGAGGMKNRLANNSNLYESENVPAGSQIQNNGPSVVDAGYNSSVV